MYTYGILISGGINPQYNFRRYRNDIAFAYTTLTKTFSYSEDYLFTLYADGSSLDLDGDGDNDVTGPATAASVRDVFRQLSAAMTSEDLCFILTTNHGHLEAGESSLCLWGTERLSATELSQLVSNLEYRYLIATLGQCYSGGFIDQLQGSNRVICTACRWDEPSHAAPNGQFDEFLFHWVSALRGETPYGVATSADLDGDGFVSVFDAFSFARQNRQAVECPQYKSQPPELGQQISLFGPP